MLITCLKSELVGMNKKEIEQAISDYKWMINEIKRQRELMGYKGGNLVAHIDDMPKGKGTTGDPVAQEVIRRDKASRWVQKLEEIVLFIQQRIHIITDPKEKVVLECMLDGLSMVAIGKHMGLSRRHIYTLKESIISQFAHFAHNAHDSHEMTTEKQCV